MPRRRHCSIAGPGGCTASARRGAARVDFLHAEIAERIVDRLDDVGRQFRAVLDLGAHGGALSRALAARPGVERVVAADPAAGFLRPSAALPVVADPELLPFRRGELRSRGQRAGAALGRRSARRADPAAPDRQAGRAVSRRRCSAAPRSANCAPRSSRPSSPKRAGPARASRRPPASPTRRRCCSAPASRCRSPMPIRSRSPIPMRWR